MYQFLDCMTYGSDIEVRMAWAEYYCNLFKSITMQMMLIFEAVLMVYFICWHPPLNEYIGNNIEQISWISLTEMAIICGWLLLDDRTNYPINLTTLTCFKIFSTLFIMAYSATMYTATSIAICLIGLIGISLAGIV